MEKLLFFSLIACSFMLLANSQTARARQYPNFLNPGEILFTDSQEGSDLLSRQVKTPSRDLQPPFNSPSETQQALKQQQSLSQFPIDGGNVQIPTRDQLPNVVNRKSEDDVTPVKRPKIKIRFDPIAAALTNFSINVMKTVNERKQGNTIVSPYSIAALLSLLQQGAAEQALEQISVVLQMTQQASAASYRAQTQDILGRHSRSILKVANNIFISEGFSLNPNFKNIAITDFDSDVTPTVFQRPLQAAQLINSWVASKTDNKIVKLINPDSISTNTQLVLVNAIYFKGRWEVPFRPQSTKPDTFRNRDGTVMSVPFMNIKRHFRAGRDKYSDTRVVVLPFEREEYFLMILLPSELSNADDLIRSLDVTQLESYMNMKSIEVVLKIPKFTVRAETDLTPVLKQMGVTQIFDSNSGLSGIGWSRDFIPQVSSAVHSAILTIDEEGGTAAASTAFAVVALSNEEPFMYLKVDRPFVAVLLDGKTNLPLFMAKIDDPSL